ILNIAHLAGVFLTIGVPSTEEAVEDDFVVARGVEHLLADGVFDHRNLDLLQQEYLRLPYLSRPQPVTVAILPVKSSLSLGMQMGTMCLSKATGDSSSSSARSLAKVAASYCRCTITLRTFLVTDRRDSNSPLMSNSPNTATSNCVVELVVVLRFVVGALFVLDGRKVVLGLVGLGRVEGLTLDTFCGGLVVCVGLVLGLEVCIGLKVGLEVGLVLGLVDNEGLVDCDGLV
ncbi:hypothetical protein C0J52_27373, partial [Blattella germanica]